MERPLRMLAHLAMTSTLMWAVLGGSVPAGAEQQSQPNGVGKISEAAAGGTKAGKTKTDQSNERRRRDRPTQIEKITVNYPHGRWSNNRYIYTPDLGFGRGGVYSWYYGQPYEYSYPYSYYGHGVSTTLGPGGTVYTAVPAWLRVAPGASRSQYSGFRFGGPQVNAFPVWSAYSPMGGYAGTQGIGAYQPWVLPGAVVMMPPVNSPEAYSAGYWQAVAEAERKRREPWAMVRLDIDPPNAMLYVDGNPIGTAERFARTGARLSLPAGEYHLEISAPEYEPISLDLKLAPGEARQIERELNKAVPRPNGGGNTTAKPAIGRPRGEVVLVVSPADARVTFDGRFACRISASGEEFRCRLTAGPHVMEVSKDGHQSHREEVIVSPLQPLAREVRLKAH